MEIRYDKAAVKYLKALQKNIRDNILTAIEGLTQKPPAGDIKIMLGYKDGRQRLRVGKCRVIYKYLTDIQMESEKENIIEILIVLEIGSHGGIYK